MKVHSSLGRNNPEKSVRPDAIKRTKSYAARLDRRSHQGRSFPKRSAPTQTVWLDSPEQDRLLRQRSLEQAKQGNYLTAVEGLSVLIERNPENATDYNNRGLVQFQWGEREAALEDYNHAIALNPKLASAYNNRANYYATQGQLADAIADYEMAVDLDPTNIRAWINQGITFRDLGLYGQAIENFDHALQISELLTRSPEGAWSLEAHLYAARGRTHHLNGDWNYATADYYRAIDRLTDTGSTSSRLHQQVSTWLAELIQP